MLNDRVRNEAYRNAIATAIQEGFDTVLDIGTGTGLLRYETISVLGVYLNTSFDFVFLRIKSKI